MEKAHAYIDKNECLDSLDGFKTIVFSPTGGTQKVADILQKAIAGSEETQTIDLCEAKTFYTETFSENDIVMIAVPSYGGRVSGTAKERIAQMQGNGAKTVLVCVYGNRAFDNTLAEMKDIAERASFHVIAAVAAIAEHSIARQVATGRPDDSDMKCLQSMGYKIRAKIQSDDTSTPSVPGKIPEKSGMNMGMAPGITKNCVKCGLCAEKCPVRAIDANTFVADKKKCISCMRCISICPQNARKLNVLITSLGGVALGTLCKERKECELFL